MKIVTRRELLEMGTVLYAEVNNRFEFPERLYIKYADLGLAKNNDLVYEEFPITQPDYPGIGTYSDTCKKFYSLPNGTESPLSELETCREGSYDSPDREVIVYSAEDILSMRSKLDMLLKEMKA